MGLNDIIEGTGNGFWFGYGRFLGVHWGRPSTQDVIEVAADPFYNEKEFSQLVTEPERRHSSRWRDSSLISILRGYMGEERVLTDEERNGIIETLFERARDYEGVAKRRMFQRLINNIRSAGTQRVRDFCVDAVDAGELEVELLMKPNMGSRVLARVEPSISTPYLERKFKDKKGDDYRRRLFMEGVLNDLGIDSSRKDSVYTSENIVPWIPLVVYAIEEDLQEYRYCADKIEEFFSGFPYESALDHLVIAIESEVCLPREEVSRESDKGTIITTYQARYPIAEGAKKSLIELEKSHPPLAQQIRSVIEKYEKRPKKTTLTEKVHLGSLPEYDEGPIDKR